MTKEEQNPYLAPDEPGKLAEVGLGPVLGEDEMMLVLRGRRIYLVVAATLLLLPLLGHVVFGGGSPLCMLLVPAVLLMLGWRGSRSALTALVLAVLFYCPMILFPPVLMIGAKFFVSASGELFLFLCASAVYAAVLWALTLSRSVQAFFAYQRRRSEKS